VESSGLTASAEKWRQLAVKRKQKEARLERLVLAVGDMADAAAAARYLIRHPIPTQGPIRWHARRALETGMLTSYARAFTRSKGDPGKGIPELPKAPVSGLTPEQRATHEWALRERKHVSAHGDRTGRRRRIGVSRQTTIDWAAVELGEEWSSPSPSQLNDLADLAEHLRQRYLAAAQALQADLHQPLESRGSRSSPVRTA
jgi:hypothetical protein